MSIHPATPLRPQNPLKAAKARLIRDFLALEMPVYPVNPSPADHQSFADAIRQAAQIFDSWLAAVGSEVRDNATGAIDANLFSGSFEAAIDGNETYACEVAACDVADQRRASRRA